MNDKELVAMHAAKQVDDGMLVGLGTGSTADLFIAELARRMAEENLNITTVSSSIVSQRKAQALAIPMVSIEHVIGLDLYVDGADEVTPDNTLLKGQGSDLVREKLLAKACDQFIVLVDASKMVDRIGARFPIPVEVMPFAWQMVQQGLACLGGQGELRKAANGLAITSYGGLVLDVVFEADKSSDEIDFILNSMPGVIEHGVFRGLADTVLLAVDGKVQAISSK
jgi:ribose 5-phosphate isomerase A